MCRNWALDVGDDQRDQEALIGRHRTLGEVQHFVLQTDHGRAQRTRAVDSRRTVGGDDDLKALVLEVALDPGRRDWAHHRRPAPWSLAYHVHDDGTRPEQRSLSVLYPPHLGGG